MIKSTEAPAAEPVTPECIGRCWQLSVPAGTAYTLVWYAYANLPKEKHEPS